MWTIHCQQTSDGFFYSSDLTQIYVLRFEDKRDKYEFNANNWF